MRFGSWKKTSRVLLGVVGTYSYISKGTRRKIRNTFKDDTKSNAFKGLLLKSPFM